MSQAENTRLLLIRHGRVHADWRERIYGALDVPLSEEGEEEADRVARNLADETLDAVVSSGLARTEHGAALLRAPRGLPRDDRPELRELERGDWAGRTFDDLLREEGDAWEAWHADPEHRRAPGGESLADVAARVLPCLSELVAELPGKRIAVVAHSWVIRVAVCDALALPLSMATRLKLGTGRIAVIDRAPGTRPTLAGFALGAAPTPSAVWFRAPRRE